LKSNLDKNNKICNGYNPDEALKKLNELIFDDSPTKPKKENDNNKIPKDIKITITNNNNNHNDIIKKNINFIKKLEECNKKGINYRSLTLSKREINLLNKKQKNLGFKFKNNSQNLFPDKTRLKSLPNNMDDSELIKINKNRIVNYFEKEKIKEDDNNNNDKLNKSFS
jgi:hypothetical protein